MVELAGHILDTKAAHFDPSKFKDEYETALKTLVKRKAAGKPIKAAEPEEKPDNVISLMDALKAELEGQSLGQARMCRRGGHRTARPKKRTARRHGRARRGKGAILSTSLRAQRSNPAFLLAVRWIASLRSQ